MKSIILFSGGIDSLLTWSILKEYSDPIAIMIDRHTNDAELDAAYKLVQHYNIPYKWEEMPELYQPENYHTTNYIPCRNALMLTIAANHAIKEGASQIAIGINKDDYNDYVDCRLNFIQAFEDVLRLYDKNLMIMAPLIWLTKTEIIKRATTKNLALEMTHTCYFSSKEACGSCNACKLRLKSFQEAGLKDPIKYVQS
jgi:7-cyano-7-deazaguanine synthase